jgi:hypothetical protein
MASLIPSVEKNVELTNWTFASSTVPSAECVITDRLVHAATAAKWPVSASYSVTSGQDIARRPGPACSTAIPRIRTSERSSGTPGAGRLKTPSITENIDATAPIPSVNVRMIVTVVSGVRAKWRTAYRASPAMCSTTFSQPALRIRSATKVGPPSSMRAARCASSGEKPCASCAAADSAR